MSTGGRYGGDTEDDECEPPRYSHEREAQSAEASRKVEMARAERVYRNLQRSEVLIRGNLPEDKGKKKLESTGSKKSGIRSRYSILGGMM
jgi:uncharacterized protein YdaT